MFINIVKYCASLTLFTIVRCLSQSTITFLKEIFKPLKTFNLVRLQIFVFHKNLILNFCNSTFSPFLFRSLFNEWFIFNIYLFLFCFSTIMYALKAFFRSKVGYLKLKIWRSHLLFGSGSERQIHSAKSAIFQCAKFY